MGTKKIGRDAGTGKFKSVKDAEKDKPGSIVESIKTPPKKPKTKKNQLLLKDIIEAL